MKKTGIDWTDYSWNPWQGCKKISPACDNCYMFTDKKRYGQKGSDIHKSAKATFNKPLKIEAGSKVFTCSWSDFFLVEADEWRDEAWDIIRATPHLTYQILTKRPENIKDRLPKDWEESFSHVWLGVTAENQEQADVRIPILLDIPGSKRFISIEPMLELVDLSRFMNRTNGYSVSDPVYKCEHCGLVGWGQYFSVATGGGDYECQCTSCYSLVEEGDGLIRVGNTDWVIVGGESGAKSKVREMKPEWVQKIYDDCRDNDVPFFFKQWGSHKPSANYEFESIQEFPNGGIK